MDQRPEAKSWNYKFSGKSIGEILHHFGGGKDFSVHKESTNHNR